MSVAFLLKSLVLKPRDQLLSLFSHAAVRQVVAKVHPDKGGARRTCSACYRKKDEAAKPALASGDPYGEQVKLGRAVPMWGGISEGGAAVVMWHPRKKVTTAEWVKAVQSGKLRAAIKQLDPVQADGPWTVLCDNERFLTARPSVAAYGHDVALWQVPAKSPDLNPVEKFWGWMRRELRKRDLADLWAKRPVPGKLAYKRRIRSMLESRRAQRVAKKFAASLKKVCREVVQKKGAQANC